MKCLTASSSIVFATFIALAGCNKTPPGDAKNPLTPPSEANKPPLADSVPFPKSDANSTRIAAVGDYQVALPPEFVLVSGSKDNGEKLRHGTWKGPTDADGYSPLIFIFISTDEKSLAESRKNMRQWLVNFSAGAANKHYEIATRDRTETSAINGFEFSRFRWAGSRQDQTPVRGLAYGAIDDVAVITILVVNFGAKAEENNKVLESALSTFNRK